MRAHLHIWRSSCQPGRLLASCCVSDSLCLVSPACIRKPFISAGTYSRALKRSQEELGLGGLLAQIIPSLHSLRALLDSHLSEGSDEAQMRLTRAAACSTQLGSTSLRSAGSSGLRFVHNILCDGCRVSMISCW